MAPIPEDQRYGSSRRNFTVWFAPNMELSGVFTGTLAFTIGLGLWSGVVAIMHWGMPRGTPCRLFGYLGSQDRDGAAAARSSSLRQKYRPARGRAVAERHRLGRPRRALWGRGSPGAVPYTFRAGSGRVFSHSKGWSDSSAMRSSISWRSGGVPFWPSSSSSSHFASSNTAISPSMTRSTAGPPWAPLSSCRRSPSEARSVGPATPPTTADTRIRTRRRRRSSLWTFGGLCASYVWTYAIGLAGARVLSNQTAAGCTRTGGWGGSGHFGTDHRHLRGDHQ